MSDNVAANETGAALPVEGSGDGSHRGWFEQSLRAIVGGIGAAASLLLIVTVLLVFFVGPLVGPTLVIYWWIGMSGITALVVDIVATLICVSLVVLIAGLAD